MMSTKLLDNPCGYCINNQCTVDTGKITTHFEPYDSLPGFNRAATEKVYEQLCAHSRGIASMSIYGGFQKMEYYGAGTEECFFVLFGALLFEYCNQVREAEARGIKDCRSIRYAIQKSCAMGRQDTVDIGGNTFMFLSIKCIACPEPQTPYSSIETLLLSRRATLVVPEANVKDPDWMNGFKAKLTEMAETSGLGVKHISGDV